MRPTSIEHVNITVSDIDRAVSLLSAVFGWKVRWRGAAMADGESAHVGSDDVYIALYKPKYGAKTEGGPLNHIGVLVEDIDETEQKVRAAGLSTYAHGDYQPGRRFYFSDGDDIEFEVVSYA